jgi:hypothetical protein
VTDDPMDDLMDEAETRSEITEQDYFRKLAGNSEAEDEGYVVRALLVLGVADLYAPGYDLVMDIEYMCDWLADVRSGDYAKRLREMNVAYTAHVLLDGLSAQPFLRFRTEADLVLARMILA